MSDDLVERVADLVRHNTDPIAIAEEAIAIALEEAARVADETITRDQCVAAAIRAMIPNGNDPAPDDTGSAE
jgi:hypothetical protein